MAYLITHEFDETLNESIMSNDLEKLKSCLDILNKNNLKDKKVIIEHIKKDENSEGLLIDKDFSDYLWCRAVTVVKNYRVLGRILSLAENGTGPNEEAVNYFLDYAIEQYKGQKQSSYDWNRQFINELIKLNNSELLEKLIDYKMWVFGDDMESQDHIDSLISANMLGILKKILDENKIDLDFDCNIGSTPLIVAITCGKPDAIKLLLENGADINFKGSLFNRSPLSIAIKTGDLEVQEVMLSHILGDKFIKGLKDDDSKAVSECLLNEFDDNISKSEPASKTDIIKTLFFLLEFASENKSTACYKAILDKITQDFSIEDLDDLMISKNILIRSVLNSGDFDNVKRLLSMQVHNQVDNPEISSLFYSIEVEYLVSESQDITIFDGMLDLVIGKYGDDSSYLDNFIGNIIGFANKECLIHALEVIENRIEDYSPIKALNKAITLEHCELLEILADHPNVNLNEQNYFPFTGAIKNNDLKSVNILLKAGADPTNKPKKSGDDWLLTFTTDKAIYDVLAFNINKISMERLTNKELKEHKFYTKKVKSAKIPKVKGVKI